MITPDLIINLALYFVILCFYLTGPKVLPDFEVISTHSRLVEELHMFLQAKLIRHAQSPSDSQQQDPYFQESIFRFPKTLWKFPLVVSIKYQLFLQVGLSFEL